MFKTSDNSVWRASKKILEPCLSTRVFLSDQEKNKNNNVTFFPKNGDMP